MNEGPADPGTKPRTGPAFRPAPEDSDERAYMIGLGRRLRALREARGLTQEHLARRARIATDMISRLENGRYTSPGLRTILRIARGMGLSPVHVLPDQHEPISAAGARARVRLTSLLSNATAEDVELIAEIASVVLARRNVS